MGLFYDKNKEIVRTKTLEAAFVNWRSEKDKLYFKFENKQKIRLT